MNELSEPTLWGIAIAVSGVVVWMGKRAFAKLDDCEKSRELMHRKVGKQAAVCSVKLGDPIDLETENVGWYCCQILCSDVDLVELPKATG